MLQVKHEFKRVSSRAMTWGLVHARRALYATLLAPELPGSTKAAMFLSMLFRAVKADVSSRRVAAFLKRLLQIALAAPANLACGCLLLASEILKVTSEPILNSS